MIRNTRIGPKCSSGPQVRRRLGATATWQAVRAEEIGSGVLALRWLRESLDVGSAERECSLAVQPVRKPQSTQLVEPGLARQVQRVQQVQHTRSSMCGS